MDAVSKELLFTIAALFIPAMIAAEYIAKTVAEKRPAAKNRAVIAGLMLFVVFVGGIFYQSFALGAMTLGMNGNIVLLVIGAFGFHLALATMAQCRHQKIPA